jgi:transposase-like protein/Fe2+ transport system protein FeoA
MKIKITLYCPDCQSTKIKKNGKKSYGKQNYLCKECGKQFIGDHALNCKGCHSGLIRKILLIPVRGICIRDISVIEQISIKKVLSVLTNSHHVVQPQQQYYDRLEADEFWTYVGKKNNRVWLIYAYHRETNEIVASVWGKRNLKTTLELKQKLIYLGITYGSTVTVLGTVLLQHLRLKIILSGSNIQLEYRAIIAVCDIESGEHFGKLAVFQKLFNHLKSFDLAFFYINYGLI